MRPYPLLYPPYHIPLSYNLSYIHPPYHIPLCRTPLCHIYTPLRIYPHLISASVIPTPLDYLPVTYTPAIPTYSILTSVNSAITPTPYVIIPTTPLSTINPYIPPSLYSPSLYSTLLTYMSNMSSPHGPFQLPSLVSPLGPKPGSRPGPRPEDQGAKCDKWSVDATGCRGSVRRRYSQRAVPMHA